MESLMSWFNLCNGFSRCFDKVKRYGFAVCLCHRVPPHLRLTWGQRQFLSPVQTVLSSVLFCSFVFKYHTHLLPSTQYHPLSRQIKKHKVYFEPCSEPHLKLTSAPPCSSKDSHAAFPSCLPKMGSLNISRYSSYAYCMYFCHLLISTLGSVQLCLWEIFTFRQAGLL